MCCRLVFVNFSLKERVECGSRSKMQEDLNVQAKLNVQTDLHIENVQKQENECAME